MPEQNVKSSFILGFFLFFGLAFLGYFIGTSAIKFKEYERTVTVKGLSEKEYPADIVLWPIQISVADNDLSNLYVSLGGDIKSVIDFLIKNGFKTADITMSPPSIIDKLAQQYGNNSKIEFRYTAIQTITVYSTKVSSARSTMNKLVELGKKGIVFSGDNYRNITEYIFTKLNEVKPKMVEEATTKEREVALKFAKDSNSKLGKIKKAKQGQFSINNRDKHTPHIKKVRVVSTVEYYLSD